MNYQGELLVNYGLSIKLKKQTEQEMKDVRYIQ